MKARSIVILLLFIALIPSITKAQTYDKLWKQVEKAQEKSLPQTVIELTNKIYDKASSEQDMGQMLKAYVVRMKSREWYTPDSFYVDLQSLQQWEERAESPTDKAMLNSLIMEFYSNYANDNSYDIRRRTPIVDEEAADDIRLWTSNQFAASVLTHGLASIQNETELLKTSSREFTPFVIEGESSGYYHHNLYQLLTSRAIASFKAMSSISNIKQYTLTIDSLYQQLMAAYHTNELEDGHVLTALSYAEWKYNKGRTTSIVPRAATELPQNNYVESLDNLIAQYPHRIVCAEVYVAKAQYALMKQQSDLALQYCDEGLQKYGSYKRINKLRNIRNSILQPLVNGTFPKQAYPDSKMAIQVSYKNMTSLSVEFLKGSKVVSQQSVTLSNTPDYKLKDTTVYVMAPALGKYQCRITSMDEKKKSKSETEEVSVSRFKVVAIGLFNAQSEYVVVDALSGQPIPEATIQFLDDDKPVASFTTDANGIVVVDNISSYQRVVVTKGDDISMNPIYTDRIRSSYTSSDEREKVQLITDRSIYRPGQTVYVKGIAYSSQNDTASVIPNKTYSVTLYDANRQEVSKKELTTNEFGSFTTEFVLPSACLNGRFRIVTDNGSTNIQVEDYKLPTFEVTLEGPTVSYNLGDTVDVSGKAISLNGVPLQDVPVKYTVSRIINTWWLPSRRSGETIASGEVMLNDGGDFTIPVPLIVKEYQEFGYYSYTVEASVTSLAGETQIGSFSLNAGTRSMMLNADIPQLVCKESMPAITIKAVNLDCQPLEVSGGYSLFSMAEGVTSAEAIKQSPSFDGTFVANQALANDSWKALPSGKYVMIYNAFDNQGREVEGEKEFTIFSLDDTCPPTQIAEWYYEVNSEFDAYNPAIFYYGTSFNDAHVMMKVLCKDKVLESKILKLSNSIERFEFDYKDSYENGLTVLFCFVKDNKLYRKTISLKKKVADKNLTMKWEVFRDKLRPGQSEEWKMTIKTPQCLPANAEMLALMYDAALDQLYPNNQTLRVWYNLPLPSISVYSPYARTNQFFYALSYKMHKVPELVYDHFMPMNGMMTGLDEVVVAYGVRGKSSSRGSLPQYSSAPTVMARSMSNTDAMDAESTVKVEEVTLDATELPEGELRTNFSETAFFYPQLRTNEQGEVSFAFTMPQSLTRWTFKGFAHTKGMLTGNINASATTSKEFMLMPNMPRFVRIGDEVTIAATITNLSDKAVAGNASMTLFNPLNERVISTQKQRFAVEAGKTTAVSFTFKVTNQYEMLGCRMIADGGTFSDGEQRVIPVLSDKIHLTETVAMPIRGEETRTFSLQHLFNNHSATATNRSLTVECTGNPAWYAVQALPAIALPENNNAIAWATAYYANSLAEWIVNQQPRIKTIFETWKQQGGTKETLISNLQKNQELKNIILSESPWVMEAKTEQEQMQRIATLFDVNNIRNNNLSAVARLTEMQNSDGAWCWFKGMTGSYYVTQYIAELNARLALLTGESLSGKAKQMQTSAMNYLHKSILERYNNMPVQLRSSYSISNDVLKYLYVVAISNEKVPAANAKAYNFYLSKVGDLLQDGSMANKAMAAIILNKAGNKVKANEFMASLKEHLVKTDEQGMYFAFHESPYAWGGLQMPAHVLVMQAFNTVMHDTEVVEEMKIWLLKQKQTQAWKSPVASADAIYALLMTGTDLLDNNGDVQIKIGNQTIQTGAAGSTPGLGYVKDVYTSKQIVDAQKVTVTKRDAGIAWGAVYAQYQENISNVSQQGNELNVDKKLYVLRIVDNQKQLVPVTADTKLAIGDVVVSRLAITLDRPMEFIQLKDQRAACFEPIASISGYRWNSGFGYYVDIKDASTSFFFDGLGKGVYVLEYSYRVSRAGQYQSGIATMQSAYAPEYASHSASMPLIVE